MALASSSPINVGHVDDVQELKKAKPGTVPDRFVRDMAERPNLTATLSSSSATDIPIVDLSKLLKSDKDEHQSEILQLKMACEEWGIFQVVNHGIEMNVLENLEKVAKDFFMLPIEEKQKYPLLPGTIHGYGQAFVLSEDQKLDWCNTYALGIEPPYMRNPEFWPSKPADFSETLEIYSREIKKLCKNVLKNIALTLGLKEGALEEIFGEAGQAVRMNYYPSCPRPELVLGLSPHSDGSGITVLQQGKDSLVGLHVLKDKTWVPVQPIPNALVIIFGDTMEVLTNGKYKSVEHRVVTHKEKDRLSIVSYYAPNIEIELGPMPEMVDEKNPCRFRRYSHEGYFKNYLSYKLQGKKSLEYAKIDFNIPT